MLENPTRYTITAALPYTNGPIHIGHLAGVYVPSDIYARYLRLQGKDVAFICGSDEHGVAISMKARKEGITPQEVIDKYDGIIRKSFEDFGISFDNYSRTSAKIHHDTASEFFRKLYDDGKFIEETTEQLYDEQANQFLADRFVTGTCPKCGNEEAYGDQCEKCGSTLNATDLINPKSTITGSKPVLKSTKHWFLPLNEYDAFLREWILNEHKADWKTNVLGQCKGWIEAGLQPRAVTRDLDWGVSLPQEIQGGAGKVLYVWFDAPIGYISATKQWALDNGKAWEPYWQDKDTKLVHFIGKDNIVFHCIIFPVMLKLHGNILPDNVPSNEFMNLEGDKMSTSRGWSIEMDEYINDFVKKENGGSQMVDALRYYLTNIAPESKDSEFTWKGFQEAVNSDIVGKLGNFVNRSFVLMHKLCGGKVPAFHPDIKDADDAQMIAAIASAKNAVEEAIENYRFRDALFEVIMLSDAANKYMQKKEPWIVARQTGEDGKPTAEAQKLIDNCLHICLQTTANLAVLIHPFLPFAAKKMCYMMKVVDKMLDWENAGKMNLLSVGYSLRAPELLFRKIEDAEVQAQVEKLKARAAALKSEEPASTPAKQAEERAAKPEIVFDDFAKIDLRVGTIVAAEKVEKADKLLKLQVNLGTETRTIVSGIALHFEPDAIVGKQVTVVTNLAPRKMRGIESNGMILMAEDADGKLVFVNPNVAVANGSGVS